MAEFRPKHNKIFGKEHPQLFHPPKVRPFIKQVIMKTRYLNEIAEKKKYGRNEKFLRVYHLPAIADQVWDSIARNDFAVLEHLSLAIFIFFPGSLVYVYFLFPTVYVYFLLLFPCGSLLCRAFLHYIEVEPSRLFPAMYFLISTLGLGFTDNELMEACREIIATGIEVFLVGSIISSKSEEVGY